MRFFQDVILPAVALVAAVEARPPRHHGPCDDDDVESGRVLQRLGRRAFDATMALAAKNPPNHPCRPQNVHVRREWRTLPLQMRKDYVKAALCLTEKESLFEGSIAGAKSLFDDFMAVHMQQTMNIHLSGTFLTWHRYYTWAYEQKLRTACGYTGDFPYWEWGLDVDNPAASPLFDGSDASLGSDGEFFEHEGYHLLPPFQPDPMIQEPGSGGGCVHTGPFSEHVVRLGPIALNQFGTTNTTAAEDPFADNSRCLKRDLNSYIPSRNNRVGNSTRLILDHDTIETFQNVMEGNPAYLDRMPGIHTGGHFTIGGDPGGDPFCSPGDPAFFPHHSQIDRLYQIWQMRDFENRQDVFGTQTFLNFPPSPNVTLDDVITLEPISGSFTVAELMSTVDGPFCYAYM